LSLGVVEVVVQIQPLLAPAVLVAAAQVVIVLAQH